MTPEKREQLRRDLIEDIYEYSELEHEAASAQQFIPNVWPFRWLIRLLAWAETSAARERENLRQVLKELNEGERDE